MSRHIEAMLVVGLETIQEEDGGEGKKYFHSLLNREKAISHQRRYRNSYLTQSA